MNTKVWYLPYFEGVYHTQMFETFTNVMNGSYYKNDMFEVVMFILFEES